MTLSDVFHSGKYTSFWEFEGAVLVSSSAGSRNREQQPAASGARKSRVVDVVADEYGAADGGEPHELQHRSEMSNAKQSEQSINVVRTDNSENRENDQDQQSRADSNENAAVAKTKQSTDIVFNFFGVPIKNPLSKQMI